MSDNLKITITGSNQASPAFKQVATDAQAMSNTVEQSNRRMGGSFEEFNRRAAAVGAGIGALTGVMSDWARQSVEDEANQARLQQAVENTGRSYDTYSAAIDKAIAAGAKKAFTDDDVRDSLVKLNAVTNDTSKSINELGLVEDFARARGLSLSDSAAIIGKVMGGNLGILSRYGIQIDKNATSEQALAKIQAISAGQADTYAATTQGQIAQMRIRWDEATEAIGRHTGSLQGLLAVLPGLSAGFSGMSAVIGGLAGGKGGLAGIGGLVGLGTQIAGAGALGTLAYGYAQNDVGTTFANDLANKIFITMSTLINAAIPGSPLNVQKYYDQQAENKTWDAILSVFGSPAAAGAALGVRGSLLPSGNVSYAGGAVDANGNPIGYPIPQAPGTTPVTTPQYAKPDDAQVYAAITNAAAAGNMTVAQYLATPAVRSAGIQATATRYVSGPSPNALAGVLPPSAPFGTRGLDWWASHIGVGGTFGYGPGGGQQRMTYGAGGAGAVANDLALGGGFDASTRRTIAHYASLQAAHAVLQAVQQYAPGLGFDVPMAGLSGRISGTAGTAARTGTTNAAAASGFQVAVGQTNAIGKQAQDVADWAKELINVRGTTGEIDRLLAKGIISQQEYNRAQSAQTSIFHENAAIQRDVLKIQTDQSPVIARLTKEQADYMGQIAGMAPQQQMLTLAYMDQGEATKAQTALTLAAAAANGELGKSGEHVATQMITAAAEADPYLSAMLEDMNVIRVGADGKISVNWDDVKNSQSDMQDLIGAIGTLSSDLEQIFGINVDDSDLVNATSNAYALSDGLDKIDNRQVTYTVATVYTNTGSAGAGIGPANEPIGGVPYTPPASGGGGTDPFGSPTGARLGGLIGYANGGIVIHAGEAGPELMHFAGGGVALAMQRGRYAVPRGTYVDTAPLTKLKLGGGGVTIHGANFHFHGLQTASDVQRQIQEFAYGGAR